MIDPFLSAGVAGRDDIAYQSWSAAGKRAAMRADLNDRTAGPMPSFGRLVHGNALPSHAYAPGGATPAGEKPDIVIENAADDEYGFDDVLDVINPLQHLPVIGTIYRKLTGDTIKPISDIIGGGIFGGPVGAVASTVNAIVKNRTGRDVAENAFALAGFDMTPGGAAAAKPNIIYDASLGETNDLAAQTDGRGLTASGQKNFAAYAARDRIAPSQSWNV